MLRIWIWLLVMASAGAASGEVSYTREVRPILSGRCFYCHGPDENTQEAGLRLDTFEGATADHDGVRAIVPGDPEASELIYRVTAHGEDADDLMPPAKSKKEPLSGAEVEVLKRWITEGARYEKHWALVPVGEAAVPEVDDGGWGKNGVDAFVWRRLAAEGIEPAAEADPRTLVRRVYLDLIGLLPEPGVVWAFVDDYAGDPEGAWGRLVDGLLASVHYGERWGRHWLDGARYADSHGYSIDSDRAMWPYRDWVIAALNADLPFDQFTKEQLAGDLMPGATKAQRVASAFHRNTMINQEGGTDPEQFRVEAAVDRTNTTGAVWLGLTLGCAQCHTHKFDPITHEDYFRMYAFFNQGTDRNNTGATVEVSTGEMFAGNGGVASEEEQAALAEAKKKLESAKEESGKRQARWEAMVATGREVATRWEVLRVAEAKANGGGELEVQVDGSLLLRGKTGSKASYEVLGKAGTVAAVRLEVLTDKSLPKSGPGTAGNGNFVLTGFEVRVGGKALKVKSVRGSHSQPGYPAEAAVDGDAETGWAINVGNGTPKGVAMNARHEVQFVLAEPVDAGAGLEVVMRHDKNENYLVGRFRLSVAGEAPRVGPLDDGERKAVEVAAKKDEKDRSGEEKALLAAVFRRIDPVQGELAGEVAALERQISGGKRATGKVMVMEDLPEGKRRKTHVQLRGDFLNPDLERGELEPGFPAVFGSASGDVEDRRDLADWLVAEDNPLTARVTVNRMWMRYFGRGLVETENDFGLQGSLPSHPGLLDWLAGEFMRRGWSMKAVHRLIVTSATYRQSSAWRADLAKKDARNLLLARQSRNRVEAEVVRDAALSASGLLDPAVGGPSVYPPQPAGVYAFTQNRKSWRTSAGGDRFRRTMYTFFYRSAPHPLLTTFDTPDFGTTCTARVRSNTPLQALTMANDAGMVEIAAGLGRRMMEAEDSAAERVKAGYRFCFGREPSAEELGVMLGFVAEERAGGSEEEVWAAAARVLINTDEFVTRE